MQKTKVLGSVLSSQTQKTRKNRTEPTLINQCTFIYNIAHFLRRPKSPPFFQPIFHPAAQHLLYIYILIKNPKDPSFSCEHSCLLPTTSLFHLHLIFSLCLSTSLKLLPLLNHKFLYISLSFSCLIDFFFFLSFGVVFF